MRLEKLEIEMSKKINIFKKMCDYHVVGLCFCIEFSYDGLINFRLRIDYKSIITIY
jgi:hypothetical protein